MGVARSCGGFDGWYFACAPSRTTGTGTGGGDSNNMPPAVAAPQLVRFEQPDDAVFAVIAGVADHLAGAQPRHGFGEHGGIRPRNFLERHRLQNVELGAEG